ncbi:hypothetical protein [Corynebacterium haemomassiliense]|uniref:hypothetical protein n=1 Tax=Corynebacterium haemomassiliense TaxID=2754726 RepID=UPI00288A9098|nr:hypothetical protein [Corynebacterium haemomassiliense]
MSSRRIPRAIEGGLSEIGEALQRWRRLNRLTIEQAAHRADVSVSFSGYTVRFSYSTG